MVRPAQANLLSSPRFRTGVCMGGTTRLAEGSQELRFVAAWCLFVDVGSVFSTRAV